MCQCGSSIINFISKFKFLEQYSRIELEVKVSLILKVGSILISLHLGIPIIASLRLLFFAIKIRSIEEVNEGIKSPFQFIYRRPLGASNKFAKKYITFLQYRREAIWCGKNEQNKINALELLDGLDFEILKYLLEYASPSSPMAELAHNLITDLLNLRQLQGLPRYPKGWAEGLKFYGISK